MRRKTINKVLTAILLVAFALMIFPGYISAVTNNARFLSTAEMRAFIGQEGTCECAFPIHNCQTCQNVGSQSGRYNSGDLVYTCTALTATPEDECYDTSHECGTAESGGGYDLWNVNNCPGEPDDFYPADKIMDGAIGSLCGC